MLVYRYQVKCYGSIIDFTHECGETQTQLYIPGQGVIGYRSKDQIDFFSADSETIAGALAIIEGRSLKKREGKYLGEIDLPEDEVMQVVSAGKLLNHSRADFEKATKSLIEKIEE